MACRHAMNNAHRKLPPRHYQRDAPHPAQIRHVRAGGVCEGRNTAGSSYGASSRESKAPPGSADSQALAVAPVLPGEAPAGRLASAPPYAAHGAILPAPPTGACRFGGRSRATRSSIGWRNNPPLVASAWRLRRAKPAGLPVRSAGAFRLSWSTSPRSRPGPGVRKELALEQVDGVDVIAPPARRSRPTGLLAERRPLRRGAGEQVIDRRGVVTSEAFAPEEPRAPHLVAVQGEAQLPGLARAIGLVS